MEEEGRKGRKGGAGGEDIGKEKRKEIRGDLFTKRNILVHGEKYFLNFIHIITEPQNQFPTHFKGLKPL